MRGGLGRTLLTAFLILAIVPLSALSWYATQREQHDIQRIVTTKLSSVAAMMETQVRQWIENRAAGLTFLAAIPTTRENISVLTANPADLSSSEHHANIARDALRTQLRAVMEQDVAFRRLTVLDSEGQVLVSTDPQLESLPTEYAPTLRPGQDASLQFITLDPAAETGAVVIRRIVGQNRETLGILTGQLNLSGLAAGLQAVSELGKTGEIYLVDTDGMALPQGRVLTSPGIEAVLADGTSEGLYENYDSVPVIGVYRWIPELALALVAEQAQEEAFVVTDAVTAAIIGATLAVALVTAIIASVVTRQITRPVVRLTESALNIARGDLEQRVPVKMFSRDEIGILAHVFNRMATELKSLYDDLEAKVAQRTALLQRANYQIQRRAIQLAATVKVSQAVTSILEPDQLLREVVRLVHDLFSYSYVGIYLLDDDGKRALLREATGGGKRVAAVKAEPVLIEEESAIGKTVLTGEPCIIQWDVGHAPEVFASPYICAEAALSLKLGERRHRRVIGVLDILDTGNFDDDDVSVLQNVANQIAIALDNARIYKKEQETARRLRETEEFRSRFLAHMSHELREPLTNITGFSRLILKGLDGPITDQQRQDIQIIYANSQHLLGLINDLLDISQIEAGLMELQFQELDLAEIIKSVLSTASALVRGKDVELRQEIIPDLPLVRADAARIRQVLLRLLTNAAKFTEAGSITVRAWPNDRQVLISVSDTGTGIPFQDQESIFERFEQRTLENGHRPNGPGLGLALSREFIEMHGGEIWVESELGKGSTFTLSLPLEPRSGPRRAPDEIEMDEGVE
jgi:signal transduction histidine kinase